MPQQKANKATRDELPSEERLRLTEIFSSIQGEAQHAGWPTVFVRLTGCPLRCQYCDTAYAFHGGEWFTFDQIIVKVRSFGIQHVCITGGEPLAQKNVLGLIEQLCDLELNVSIETSGAMDIAPLDSRCIKVLDLKTPGSNEQHQNKLENIAHLRPEDQVKFVICDRNDYEWAQAMVIEHQLEQICTVWYSASHTQLPHQVLANWMIEDAAPARFQMQLHKLLWNDAPGH